MIDEKVIFVFLIIAIIYFCSTKVEGAWYDGKGANSRKRNPFKFKMPKIKNPFKIKKMSKQEIERLTGALGCGAAAMERGGEYCDRSDCRGYRGQQTKTIGGYTCQNWLENSPHKKSPQVNRAYRDDYGGLGDHNFCRNPDDSKDMWCYTDDPTKRWDKCRPKLGDIQKADDAAEAGVRRAPKMASMLASKMAARMRAVDPDVPTPVQTRQLLKVSQGTLGCIQKCMTQGVGERNNLMLE